MKKVILISVAVAVAFGLVRRFGPSLMAKCQELCGQDPKPHRDTVGGAPTSGVAA